MRQPVPPPSRLVRASTVLLALSVCWLQHPSRAEACTYFPTWTAFDGFPSADAVGVPTDVSPIFLNPLEGFPAVGSVVFSLEGPDGSAVALETRAVESRQLAKWTELRLGSTLQPNTRYKLRARASYDPARFSVASSESSLEFTTGSGPAGALPAQAEVGLQHLVLGPPPVSACGLPMPTRTCLNLPKDGFFQIREAPPAEGFAETIELVRGPSFVAQLGEFGRRRCVEVSQRAADGSFAPARSVCHDQGPLYAMEWSNPLPSVACTASGITVYDAPISDRLSPVPPERWDSVRPKPIAAEAGVEDAGLHDAGSAIDAATTHDAADDKASEDERPETEDTTAADAGCSVGRRGAWGLHVALLGLALAWLARRRHRV